MRTEVKKPKETPEAEIRAYTIGELKPQAGPIVIADYNADWPSFFEREAARVRRILGDRVRLLEHAGSTSVVGLPAKPIIDMVLAVPDSSDEVTYVPDMELGGYVLRIREPHWFEHRVFNALDTKVNLHVFTADCPEIAQMLLFRDWLRSHPEDRDLYAATKRELVKREWKFVQHYADAKTEAVHEILARARAGKEFHGGFDVDR